MATTLEQVRRRLDVDEPDYVLLARELGPDAGEHLRILVEADDELIAAKAVYLASLIPAESDQTIQVAARSANPVVRLAAAAGLVNAPGMDTDQALERLLNDDDIGVRKAALRSAGRLRSQAVRAKVQEIERSDPEPALRRQASKTLSQIS